MRDEPEKQLFYYELGEDYFWLSGHYDAAEYLLGKFLNGKEKKVLDAGCGPGNFISRVKSRHAVIGVDYSQDGLRFCLKKHAVPVFLSSLDNLGAKTDSFGGLVSLEVLEHLERDKEALAEYYRVLKPGGMGLVTVPAFQFLWGPHDEWFGHVRRYSKSELIQKINQAGFKIRYCRYFKCVFFLPMWLLRVVKRFSRQYEKVKTDYIEIPKWMNRILRWWLSFEVKSNLNMLLPFGTHLICVFEKPGK